MLGTDFGTSGSFINQSTVEGTGGIGNGTAGVTNKGTILANVPTGSNGLILTMNTTFQNNGTVEASNGGVFLYGRQLLYERRHHKCGRQQHR